MTGLNIYRFDPDLRADTLGPPDAHRGREAVMAWLEDDPLALAVRTFTTRRDVLQYLHHTPEIVELLREKPGPYSQLIAQIDSESAMRAIADM
jgi:hypothetical protein